MRDDVSDSGFLPSLFKNLRRLDVCDGFLLFYIVSIARQFFWTLPDTRLSWAITVLFSFFVWSLFIARPRVAKEKLTPAFWFVVVLPLLFSYLIRLPFPDISWDVLNYRLLHGERSLYGAQFLAGDFFPSILPLNPAPDTMTAFFRRALGYRLGTSVNLLAMIWTGAILYRMLRAYFSSALIRSTAVLLVLFSEQFLFEINNYMVDLLTVPLLLTATNLIIKFDDEETREYDAAAYIGFLLGASVAFKLTNLAFAIPLGTFYVYRLFTSSPRLKTKPALIYAVIFAVVFALAIAPHAIYMYWQTGNPVFPVYNEIFHSPYWMPVNVKDSRWGPAGIAETIFWALLMPFRKLRLHEPGIYFGRISLGIIATLLCLALPRIDKRARALSVIMLAAALLWSVSTGYLRYAFPLELWSGILIVYLAHYFLTGSSISHSSKSPPARVLSFACWTFLIVQAGVACYSVSQYEWSLRPTVFTEPNNYFSEAAYILRDQSLRKFQPERNRALFNSVEIWIVSDFKTNGIEALLHNNTPMIAALNPPNYGLPFDKTSKASNQRFRHTLEIIGNRRMYSLCYRENIDAAIKEITNKGFEIGKVERLSVPFYSTTLQFQMALIEVLPPRATTNS